MIDLCSSSSDSDGLKPSMKRKRPTVSTSNKSNKQSSADSSDNDIECVGVKPPSPKKPSYGDLPRQATPTSNSNSNSNPKPKSKLKTANEKRKKLDTASSGRNDLGGGKKLRSPKSDGRRSSSPPGSSSGWWTEKPTTVKVRYMCLCFNRDLRQPPRRTFILHRRKSSAKVNPTPTSPPHPSTNPRTKRFSTQTETTVIPTPPSPNFPTGNPTTTSKTTTSRSSQ